MTFARLSQDLGDFVEKLLALLTAKCLALLSLHLKTEEM